MPTFQYRAKGLDGSVVTGFLEAGEQRQAVDRLRQQKLVVIEIGERTIGILDIIKEKTGIGKKKVSAKDLVLFSRQLSTLVSAGVPIVQGLSILEGQAENPHFQMVLGSVRTDIESGLSISDALKKHPAAFPDIYTAMIRAGEVGGILDTILERLSSYLESAEILRAKVKSAMMYPAIVLTICGTVTIFLLTFVIPTFKSIFASFGAELPMPTQMLIDVSDWLKAYWWGWGPAPFAVYAMMKYFYSTDAGQHFADAKILKAPIFGPILRKVAIAKFTRTLGTLIKSGVPIMQALETVAGTAGNVVIEEAILKTRESIREGGRLADPLRQSGLFPNMVTQMIKVGEETGSLDQMLSKIADFYDQEVDAAVKGLTSLIEPLIIVFMGIVVGSIVICMFLPMFELGSLASKE